LQCLLHCSGEPSADSLIPSNQSTTFFQTFISWHLVSGSVPAMVAERSPMPPFLSRYSLASTHYVPQCIK
ncbi:MAG: hypothetical protein IJM03_12880, partial [Treponema sp.]|nr:hypothetical protein [Treponema sp.]